MISSKEFREKFQAYYEKSIVPNFKKFLIEMELWGDALSEIAKMAEADEPGDALLLKREIIRAKALCEAELEGMLLLQYAHPKLAGFNGKFDFNQIRYLLKIMNPNYYVERKGSEIKGTTPFNVAKVLGANRSELKLIEAEIIDEED